MHDFIEVFIGGNMKTTSFLIIILGILGLLVFTNPKMDTFEEFVRQQIKEESRVQGNEMDSFLGSLLGGFASTMLAQQTLRHDYIFFSTYDTALGKSHMRAVGLLNNFFITQHLEYK